MFSLKNSVMMKGDESSGYPTCKSCEEPYSTRRIPRILDCGHCLCTACVNCTIKSNKECPICHSVTVAPNASVFPIDKGFINIFHDNDDGNPTEENIAGTSEVLVDKLSGIQSHRSLPDDWKTMESCKHENGSGNERGEGISNREVDSRCFSKTGTEVQVSVAQAVTISMEYVAASYHKERSAHQYSSHIERRFTKNPYEGSYSGTRVYNGSQSIRETMGAVEEPSKLLLQQLNINAYEDHIGNISNLGNIRSHLARGVGQLIEPFEPQDQRTTEPRDESIQGHQIVGQCPQHDKPLSFMCMTCNVWGCTACSGHQGDKEQCFSLDSLEAVKTFKLMLKDGVIDQVKYVQRIEKSLKKETSGIKPITNYYEKKAARIRAELEAVENNIKELKDFSNKSDSTNSELNTSLKKLKNAYISSRDSYSKDTIVKAMEILESSQAVLDNYPIEENVKIPLIPNIKINKKKEIIELLEAGAPLYGVQERNGVQKWSHLTLKGGQIRLHCLREDVYPNEGVALLAIRYDVLRNMVPKSCPTLFMDIGWAGERRGCVNVRMFGNNPRGRQALILCSGEQGLSYRNTLFCKRTELSSWTSAYKQEILHGGDYEHNDGSAGRAIVEDITNGGEYKQPLVDGLMASWPAHEHWKLGSFNFYTQGDPNKFTDTGFGVVTQGLEILRAAAKQDPISSSYVSDCGLIIPIL